MDIIKVKPQCPNPYKFNLLLDLDSTLIHSLSIDKEVKLVPIEYRKKFKRYIMPKYYEILERPYLQQFLDYIFQHFNVSIFTAADLEYANFIVGNILVKNKPERKIHYFFHGYHSALSESLLNSPKDLRMLWNIFGVPTMNKYNTIIIDDNSQVIKANPYNVVAAPAFELLGDNNRVNKRAIYDNWLLTAPFLLEQVRCSLIAKN